MQLSFHLDSVIILWKIPTLWLSDLHHQKVAGFRISPFHTIAIILKATLFDCHLYRKDFHSNITSNETTWSPHKVSCDLSRSLLGNLFFKWPNRLTAEKSKLKEARDHGTELILMISELGVELNCFFEFRWSRNLVVFGLLGVIRLNSLWQLDWTKNDFFCPKRWRVRKNLMEGSSESRGCSLECSGLGAFWVHFGDISWVTLMTKEKAAKEVLAQAEAPPPLGQQQATKVYI